jgi:predicted RNase H-like HicB family nuclease
LAFSSFLFFVLHKENVLIEFKAIQNQHKFTGTLACLHLKAKFFNSIFMKLNFWDKFKSSEPQRLFKVNSVNWKVFLEKDQNGWFVATVPALPGCISQGKTKQQALKNIKEAIELHLASMAEDGIPLKEKKQALTVTVHI